MSGEDRGYFSSPIKVIWRMFTLITCNLVILSGILRQGKGELKFLRHIVDHKTFKLYDSPCPELSYKMFLTALTA